MREQDLMLTIMVALTEAGCTVWRNNTGKAYQGHIIKRAGTQVTIGDARLVSFGLCVGSADIIGISPGGRFLAVEVKAPKGVTSFEQQRFIDHVNKTGGIAGVARSVDEAVSLVQS